jgi:hypothetical protein
MDDNLESGEIGEEPELNDYRDDTRPEYRPEYHREDIAYRRGSIGFKRDQRFYDRPYERSRSPPRDWGRPPFLARRGYPPRDYPPERREFPPRYRDHRSHRDYQHEKDAFIKPIEREDNYRPYKSGYPRDFEHPFDRKEYKGYDRKDYKEFEGKYDRKEIHEPEHRDPTGFKAFDRREPRSYDSRVPRPYDSREPQVFQELNRTDPTVFKEFDRRESKTSREFSPKDSNNVKEFDRRDPNIYNPRDQKSFKEFDRRGSDFEQYDRRESNAYDRRAPNPFREVGKKDLTEYDQRGVRTSREFDHRDSTPHKEFDSREGKMYEFDRRELDRRDATKPYDQRIPNPFNEYDQKALPEYRNYEKKDYFLTFGHSRPILERQDMHYEGRHPDRDFSPSIEKSKSFDRQSHKEEYHSIERTLSDVPSIAEPTPENPIQNELKRVYLEEQKIVMELERIKFEHDRIQREADRFYNLYEIAVHDVSLIDL